MSGAEAAMAIATVVGTGYSIKANRDAKKQQAEARREARRVAERNAERVEAETEEQARRERLRQKAAQSRAKAKASASGVKGQSVEQYLSFMGEEHARQLGWLKQSGRSRADIIRSGGRAASARAGAAMAQTDASAVNTLVSGAQSTYTWGDRAGWWGN
jgi:wobble nucleotide-excising tRNase